MSEITTNMRENLSLDHENEEENKSSPDAQAITNKEDALHDNNGPDGVLNTTSTLPELEKVKSVNGSHILKI